MRNIYKMLKTYQIKMGLHLLSDVKQNRLNLISDHMQITTGFFLCNSEYQTNDDDSNTKKIFVIL